jgi:hypothetical protein
VPLPCCDHTSIVGKRRDGKCFPLCQKHLWLCYRRHVERTCRTVRLKTNGTSFCFGHCFIPYRKIETETKLNNKTYLEWFIKYASPCITHNADGGGNGGLNLRSWLYISYKVINAVAIGALFYLANIVGHLLPIILSPVSRGPIVLIGCTVINIAKRPSYIMQQFFPHPSYLYTEDGVSRVLQNVWTYHPHYTSPEESYLAWCVWVWSWSLDIEEAVTHWGLLAKENKISVLCRIYNVISQAIIDIQVPDL